MTFLESMRVAGVVATAAILATAAPASAQAHGEAHVVAVAGGDSSFRYTGVAAGAGVVLRRWLGLEAHAGLQVDDSDERSAAAMLGGGATVRVLSQARGTPFVAAGASRIGDVGGPYVGGGFLYWFGGLGIRIEARVFVPTIDNRPCLTSPRPPRCAEATTAGYVQAGAAFRFGP